MAYQVADPAETWVPEDTFAARLVLIRRQMRLSQKEAATLCSLDDGSWSNWENGTQPRALNSVVRKIAEATGASANWLMWGGPLREVTLWIAALGPQPVQLNLFELLIPPANLHSVAA